MAQGKALTPEDKKAMPLNGIAPFAMLKIHFGRMMLLSANNIKYQVK